MCEHPGQMETERYQHQCLRAGRKPRQFRTARLMDKGIGLGRRRFTEVRFGQGCMRGSSGTMATDKEL